MYVAYCTKSTKYDGKGKEEGAASAPDPTPHGASRLEDEDGHGVREARSEMDMAARAGELDCSRHDAGWRSAKSDTNMRKNTLSNSKCTHPHAHMGKPLKTKRLDTNL